MSVRCITLLPHQDLIVRTIQIVNSILIIHNTGSGKTLTSLGSALALLHIKPYVNVVIFSPISVIDNFKRELQKLTKRRYENFYFFSHHKLLQLDEMLKLCKNSIVIIDEVHQLRTYKGKLAINAIECSKVSWKLMLLTATPFINSKKDLDNIFMMLLRVSKLLKPWENYLNKVTISVFEGIPEHVPEVKVIIEFVELNSTELKRYIAFYNNVKHQIEDELLAKVGKIDSKTFLVLANLMRRVGDAGVSMISPKIKRVVNIIKSNRLKSAVYSYWLKAGLKQIHEQAIDQLRNQEIFLLTGDLPIHKRKKLIDDFNDTENGVLIFSKAGGEGINLKGVRQMFILEPGWNEASERQAIARGVRYRSHDHLPKNERIVIIYRLFIHIVSNTIESFDDILREKYMKVKEEASKQVYKMLKTFSI